MKCLIQVFLLVVSFSNKECAINQQTDFVQLWAKELNRLLDTNPNLLRIAILKPELNWKSVDVTKNILSSIESDKTVLLKLHPFTAEYKLNFIIYFTNKSDIKNFLEPFSEIMNTPAYTFEAKVLLIDVGKECFQEDFYSLAKRLFYENCFNLVSTCFHHIIENQFVVYSYHPYLMTNMEIKNPKSMTDLFADKRNFNRQPFPLYMNRGLNKYPNVLEVYKVILQKLNASRLIIIEGEVIDNENKSHSLNYNVDFVFDSQIIIPDTTLFTDFTYPIYESEEIYLFIPMNESIYNLRSLLGSFTFKSGLYLWLFILISIILAKIGIYHNVHLKDLLFAVLSLIMQGTIIISTKKFSQRMFVICVSVVSFIFMNIIQVILIVNLLVPKQAHLFQTIEEVINSNYTIYANKDINIPLLEHTNYFPNLLQSISLVSNKDFDNLLKNIHLLENVAFCTKLSEFENFTNHFVFPRHFYLHKVPERIFKFVVGKYMRKNSAFTDVINRVFLRMFEAGILENRINITSVQFKYAKLTKDRTLSLHELGVVFVLLMIGNAMGLIAFLVEMLLKFRERNKGPTKILKLSLKI